MRSGCRSVFLLLLLWWSAISRGAEPPPAATRVVILGVHHSAQLLAESYQPAVFRAFFERVKPNAFCLERAPEQFARGDFYEFTYEQQFLVLPYAKTHGIAVHPVDWMPPSEDQFLGIGVDMGRPPFMRPASGFLSLLSISEPAMLHVKLFFAEDVKEREESRKFYRAAPLKERFDYARRMFLYRTFLQAMRIARVARSYRGGTVLVVIGSLHKDQIESILADEPGIELVQPSSFGSPEAARIEAFFEPGDGMAILSFNLLGLQPQKGVVDWAWVRRCLARAERRGSTETQLFATRLDVLTLRISAEQALERYRQVYERADRHARFSWDGVKDTQRVDSYFDPFGNLTVRQRARLEMAREAYKLGRPALVDAARRELGGELSPYQSAQLTGYWREFVEKMF